MAPDGIELICVLYILCGVDITRSIFTEILTKGTP